MLYGRENPLRNTDGLTDATRTKIRKKFSNESGDDMNTKSLLPLTLVALALTMANSAWSRPHGPEFPISIADIEAKAAEAFSQADSDGDGEVSPEEFASVEPGHRGMEERHRRGRHRPRGHGGHVDGWDHRAHGDDQMEADLFAALDTDGNGELSAEEFSHENHRAARKTLMQNRMFAHMDADGNGGLSPDEFPGHARRLSTLDSNADGEVTRDELRDGMRAKRDGSG